QFWIWLGCGNVLTLFIFIGWADRETQCMWQKASLMEACDIMHNQRDKIRQLKAVNNEFLCERNYVHEGSNASGDAPRDFDDNKKLQFEVLKAAEKEILLRNFIAISWAWF
ncbi:unnamed protein product, partial [Brassica oleracea var. botrytis]